MASKKAAPKKNTPAKKARKREARPKKEPGKAGRPPLFTRELGERICQVVAETGMRPGAAACECGVSERTLERWLVDGRNATSRELSEFADNIARARGMGESRLHRNILAGDVPGVSFGPGRAALEILSRTNKHYSQKVQVAVQKELEQFLDVVRGIVADDQFERILVGIAAIDEEQDSL